MQIDPSKWDILDKAWRDVLEAGGGGDDGRGDGGGGGDDSQGGLPNRWQIEQMLAMAPVQRVLLQMLAIQPGWSILDAGTGFGLLAMELAGQAPLRVTGLDIDEGLLGVARRVGRQLADLGWIDAGASLTFDEGDIYSTPYEDESFDFVVSRLVYQHLTDPHAATDELVRVIRSGGHLCLIDVDDQLSLVYPEPTDAFARLQDAYAAAQSHRGGDRQVGRKLSTYLEDAGLDVALTVVLPQAMHVPATVRDPGVDFGLSRVASVRHQILAEGIMGEAEFDECMELASTEHATSRFTVAAQVVVIGTKPA